MRIIIVGGTGYLGSRLAQHLRKEQHDVAVFNRSDGYSTLAHLCNGADAVFNLAGASIGDKRWTWRRKRLLISSRIDTTLHIVDALSKCLAPPALISITGTDYYGNTTAPCNEGMPAGQTFLARLSYEWEEAAMKASSFTRVVVLRMAPVLDAKAGALKKMLLPYKFFVGGPIGWGNQFFPWVHRDDAIAALSWGAAEKSAFGPYNVAAPDVVTMKTFAKTLGKAMHRPAIITVPPIVVRLLVGSKADAVLDGRIVDPVRLAGTSFRFSFPKLEDALRNLL